MFQDIFVKYWRYLDESQKRSVEEIWVQLGFEKGKRGEDGRMALGMDMVEYQLRIAGELIDILSDPQVDTRVTGFNPDKWQRQLLDVVDKRRLPFFSIFYHSKDFYVGTWNYFSSQLTQNTVSLQYSRIQTEFVRSEYPCFTQYQVYTKTFQTNRL